MPRTRWVMLTALFIARASLGFQFTAISAVAPSLRGDLGLGPGEIGTLIGLFMLPGVPGSLGGAALSRRFGDARVCQIGLVLMIAGGILLADAPSYTIAAVGRVTSGVGLVLANLAFTGLVTEWFIGGGIEAAMGTMLASWPAGIALGLVVEAHLAAAGHWREAILATSAYCLLALVLMMIICRTAPPRGSTSALARNRPAWFSICARDALSAGLMGALWGLFNAGLMVYFSFEPLVLTGRGVPPADASGIGSIALWISAFTLPLGGHIVERTGLQGVAVAFGTAMAGAAIFLLRYDLNATLLCGAVGIAIGLPAGTLLSLPGHILPPAARAAGLGLFYAVYYAIMAVAPAIAGLAREGWGSDEAALAFGAALFLAVMPLYALLRWTSAPVPREAPPAGAPLAASRHVQDA